jgi:Phage portal protein
MAPRTGGTPVDQSLVDRVAGVVRGAVQGARDAWFGPGEPQAPAAPPEVRGRALDYPVAVNTSYRPRGEAGENAIDFATLRALADPVMGGLDLLRLAIETRKDQMAGQRWSIRGRDETDGGPKARKIEQALRRPDGVKPFRVWQREILEDLFVIDAPTVYLAPSTKGYRIPQVMDGALLKPVLASDGRTPLPPEPAYQQVLKGVPGVLYSLDEIVRQPRNTRSHRIYGMSNVEQVVMTVNIALRRQCSQLEYYTAGSVPDVVFGVPPTWTGSQIAEFQTWWDSILSGDTAERRRARFVPGDVKPYPLKPEQLKDEYDEWLARIIAYCFSLSPQALVKQVNRATAETAKESAAEEGLEPLKLWWKDFCDEVLEKGFDAPDLEFAYVDEEITDPTVKATVVSTLAGKKPIITVDEARAQYGYDPATPEQLAQLTPPPPPQLGPGDEDESEVDDGAAAKLAKRRRRSLHPADRPEPRHGGEGARGDPR